MPHLLAILAAFVFSALAPAQAPARTPAPLAPAFAPHVSILFGGDMMFDRTVRSAVEEQGGDFIFSCIDDTLKGSDAVVANLEGPITAHASISRGSLPGDEFNYTFTFPTSTASLLLAHNIRAVNLGNNHIMNFGVGGVRSTIAALRDAGVAYFGQPRLAGSSGEAGDSLAQKIVEGEMRGVRFALINYNEFSAQGRSQPKADEPGVHASGGGASTTVTQIQAERAKGYIPLVYTHWGIEYATTSSAYMRELAHEFVDAGAEMVVGSHPHVVEEHELYLPAGRQGKGKYIYYSLGNFIFDQYWNDDVRHGLLLQVVLDASGVRSVKEIPVELEHDRRTCPMSAGG